MDPYEYYQDDDHHEQYLEQQQTLVQIQEYAGDQQERSRRHPKWSDEETLELVAIRAELDQDFIESRRNGSSLWDLVSLRMEGKGFHKAPFQCKGKWKILVNRYKGCECMETASTEMKQQHFPYYTDIQTIFNARTERMMPSQQRKLATQLVSSNKNDEGRRRKMKMKQDDLIVKVVKESMEEVLSQYEKMEAAWFKAQEERAERRRVREREWQQRMEALAEERAKRQIEWRNKEEEWKAREEARDHRRETLIAALLHRLKKN